MDYIQQVYGYLSGESNQDMNIDVRRITLSDLLKRDSRGVLYLDRLIDKNIRISSYSNLATEIGNNLNVLYYLARNDKFSIVRFVPNEDIYFEEVEPGVKLIDYLFNHKIRLSPMFYQQFDNDLRIIDYILKSKKLNTYDISPKLYEKLLTPNEDGVYPIDKFIDNETLVRGAVRNTISTNLVINYCLSKHFYEPLGYLREEDLLSKINTGETIFEFLRRNGVYPKFYGYCFKSKEIFQSLLKDNKFDLLSSASLPLLLEEYESGKTYFDLLIEKQKQGINTRLETVDYGSTAYPSEMWAAIVIKLAENNMVGFIPSLDPDLLTQKGKGSSSMKIEALLDMNRELTINNILPYCKSIHDPAFALILKNLGVDDTLININSRETGYSDKLRTKLKDSYDEGCVSCCPELIAELKSLFLNDGKSDAELIDCLVRSYTYLTNVSHPDKEMFVQELKQLITIKKHHYETFIYDKSRDTGVFDGTKVVSGNTLINTINHETGHALHFYLSADYIPSNYEEVVERVRSSEGFLDRVKEYSEKYKKIREEIEAKVVESDIRDFYESKYQGEELLELSRFLTMSKEMQKNFYIKFYNEQVLDTILADTYSVDEFINQKVKMEMRNATDSLLRNYYDAFLSIADIIDAVVQGKFRNRVLFDENGNIIEKVYGHGIRYYSRESNGFKEMIANYASIVKSKYNDFMIAYLRYVVGDELVDMIKDVYENQIVYSTKYVELDEMEESANAR